MSAGRPTYPLSAIVGQADLIEALLVCAVHPVVGGVLVRGERGTAKSTAVRALAPMLGADAPLVELPLGATLDRLVGALDLRAALAGDHRVQTGLLGAADGGVLYVDEVNLLPDHLVDALLDAAACGEVTIERDGVSVTQDARFLLVGTMNPEEGELRPQLLDRFGLGVQINGPRDARTRAQIVRRRMQFDASPREFVGAWADAERALAGRIARARGLVGEVRIGERELLRISTVCAQLELDGVRGDLVCAHAACALAALDGEIEVEANHVKRAAQLALGHRLRRDPLAPPPGPGGGPQIGDALDQSFADPPDSPGEPASELMSEQTGAATLPAPPATRRPDPEAIAGPSHSPEPAWRPDPDLVAEPPKPAPEPAEAVIPTPLPSRLPASALAVLRIRSRAAGPRRELRPAPSGRSPGGELAVLDARPARAGEPVAVRPTILAALRGDVRPQTAIVGGGRGGVLCLIVDTSGSMAARRRLARVKGALEAALRDAYARRDLVVLVGFSGASARTLVSPGAPLEHAARAVRELPAGGRTPLAAGIAHAAELLESLARGPHAARARVALLLTDGRAADPEGRARAALARVVAAAERTVVVDLEEGRVRLGLAADLAGAAGADLTRLVAPGANQFRQPGRRSVA
ncbi:MAG: VWA domain-containing protein [Solirubrobacteraceae bacterium]